jgi:iron complex outermembrane recepter protein
MTSCRILLLTLVYCWQQGAHAALNKQEIIFYSIGDTRAEISLLQLAEQANLSFFMSYDVIAGVRTNPLIGKYKLEQALAIFFADTGLQIHFDDNDNFYVTRVSQTAITANPLSVPDNIPEQADNSVEIIEVRGMEGNLPDHLKIKRVSDELQESISAKQMAKQPKQNLAESLQRSPGVSINRNLGEGGEVSVRGFGPNYNVTTVNGRTIASSKPNRNFDFRLLPSDFVHNINIVKSAPADLTAGSIGANIDIRTAKPFDFEGFHSDVTVSANTSELRPDYGYHYSALVSNVTADNKLGFMFGILNDQSKYRVDRYTTKRLAQSNILPENLVLPVLDEQDNPVNPSSIRRPLRMIYDVQNGKKKRTSINSVVQLKTHNTSLHTFDLIYASLKRTSFSSGVQYPGQSPNFRDVVVDDNNTLISGTIFDTNIDAVFEEQLEDITTFAAGYNLKFLVADWWLNVDVSHSQTKAYEVLNALIPHYVGRGSGSYIDLSFANSDILSSQTNIPLNDPTLVSAHWNGKLDAHLNDKVSEVKVDSRYLFDQGVLSELNLGLSYFEQEKSNQQYKWNDDYQCAPCGGIVDLPDALFQVVLYPDFLAGQQGNRPQSWLMLTDVEAYNQTIQNIMVQNGIVPADQQWDQTVFDPSASYVNFERSLSLYSKLNFSGETSIFDWYGNVGARYLYLNNISDGYFQNISHISLDPNSSINELRLKLTYSDAEQAQAKNHHDYVLFSSSLNFNFLNGFLLKVAGAQVISFPQIEEIGINQKFTSDDSGSVLLSGGNPDLSPYAATQYDLSLEYYADSGNALSLTLFNKNIDTYISTTTFERPFQGEVSAEVLARREQVVEIVNRNENIKGGSILGAELSARINLETLCGFCAGFALEANYTRILNNQMNSDPIRLDSVKEPQSVIEGLSEQSFNWNLSYENQGFNALLTYSWRSAFLHSRQGIRTGGIPEHTAALGQLDGRLSYHFNPTFELFVEAFNLTNEAYLEYADIRSRVTHLEQTDVKYQLGLRMLW